MTDARGAQTKNTVSFISIKLYFYSAKTLKLSLGALQSPGPEPPHLRRRGAPKVKHSNTVFRRQKPSGTSSTTTGNETWGCVSGDSLWHCKIPWKMMCLCVSVAVGLTHYLSLPVQTHNVSHCETSLSDGVLKWLQGQTHFPKVNHRRYFIIAW